MSSPRAENVLKHVSIVPTMLRLKAIESEDEAIRNIPCPFHNFGRERRPSGRVYPEHEDCPSGRFHCFTCQKSWNPIDFVMDYKQLGFLAAIRWLETQFKVPALRVEDFLPPPVTAKAPTLRSEDDLKQALGYADSLLRRLRGGVTLETFRLLCDITDVLYVKVRSPNVDVCRQVDALLEKLKGLGRAADAAHA